MEQKKLLWVVVAVGAFLLIVIGTALILYAPSKNSDPVIASIPQQTHGRGIQPDPDAWVRNPETAPPFSATENDPRQISELTVVSGNTTVISDRTTFDITGLTPPEVQQTTVTGQNSVTEPVVQAGQVPTSPGEEIQPPPAITPPPAAVQQQSVQQAAPQPTAAQTAPVTARPAAAQQSSPTQPPASKPAAAASTAKPAAPVRQSAAVQQPAAAKQTASVSAPKKQQVTEYWIQAGSFAEKMRAEQVRQNLSASKITAEVFTKDIDGKLFYRVRTGPYKTKTEAEYWLGVVQNTPDFGDSYISEVQTLR
ncbi:MAG: SPOR domain-containing protein [Spirochaetaceae bacterium]|jgi:cell division protein FtsN|nr:SPOR domain-containing protein [Spirochaetaceae bacterium]